MKHLKFLIMAVLFTIAPTAIFAEDEIMQEEVFIEGIVNVVKGDDQEISAVMVKTANLDEDDKVINVVYKVMLDENGKKLGAELEGKNVEITCTVTDKGTEEKPDYWVTVKRYVVVEEPEN